MVVRCVQTAISWFMRNVCLCALLSAVAVRARADTGGGPRLAGIALEFVGQKELRTHAPERTHAIYEQRLISEWLSREYVRSACKRRRAILPRALAHALLILSSSPGARAPWLSSRHGVDRAPYAPGQRREKCFSRPDGGAISMFSPLRMR